MAIVININIIETFRGSKKYLQYIFVSVKAFYNKKEEETQVAKSICIYIFFINIFNKIFIDKLLNNIYLCKKKYY